MQKLHQGRDCCIELDMETLDDFLELREMGLPVSNKDIKEIALKVNHLMLKPNLDFKASDGWLRRWKKRNAVAIRRGTNEAQCAPQDMAAKVSVYSIYVKIINRCTIILHSIKLHDHVAHSLISFTFIRYLLQYSNSLHNHTICVYRYTSVYRYVRHFT